MDNPVSGIASVKEKSGCRSYWPVFFATITLLILFCLALGPITPTVHHPFGSVSIQRVHAINFLLLSYANDHDQRYPDGKNSTEVFQKLIDQKYCTDSTLFYLPLPGKVRPSVEQKLKPENVCFDVTSGIDSSSPDQLPVVFVTGYKVAYVPSGDAVPVTSPSSHIRTWSEWWFNEKSLNPPSGIAITYKTGQSLFIPVGKSISSVNDSGMQLKKDPEGASNGTISHFISPDFEPDGKTYRQLTPEGVLP